MKPIENPSKVHGEGQAQIFNNPYLEALTKTSLPLHISYFGTLILAIAALALYRYDVPIPRFISLFFIGFVFWTLAEYLLHRYLFHWVSESKVVQRFHFMVHGSHHQYPLDEERTLMPPLPLTLISAVFFLFFLGVFYLSGEASQVTAFFSGFASGYLLYSVIHYCIHQKRPPRFMKRVWHHHNLHHFKYDDLAFGVSTPFWDWVFGTLPPSE